MNTQTLKKSDILDFLDKLKQKGSFSGQDYQTLNFMINEVGEQVRQKKLTIEDVKDINSSFGLEFLKDTLQGRALLKPFGYAGDFEMIDKIYTNYTSNNHFHKCWDNYFQSHSAAKAVRNRKEYFKKLVRLKLMSSSSLKLMNIASGPARDLFEIYSGLNPNIDLETTCIEMDENAIKYAKVLNKVFLDKIKFIHKNIFRYTNNVKFDIIWSSGLFDYFNDKAFVVMLNRMKEWINETGEIIIGNFNENYNPSRNYMEFFTEWYLNHRTETQLVKLAGKAGFNNDQIYIGRENENVNLFLHIKMK